MTKSKSTSALSTFMDKNCVNLDTTKWVEQAVSIKN